MNISELARKLRITTSQLHEVLPHMGIDVGGRAIKIDERVANRILRNWSHYQHLLIKEVAPEEEGPVVPVEKKPVKLPTVITVRDFAVVLNIPVTKLIQTLMNNGILTALNEKIDYDTAAIIAEDLGFLPERSDPEADDAQEVRDPVRDIIDAEDKKNLVARPPVVVVMGHVDHGKTTLLDAIRETNVIAQESGGITQHIGAYQALKKAKKTGEERLITFLDTPGHEAFTTMRSRGAKIADIAILVVAADDGVKPQTIEAIKISQAASIPIIVAINKTDKEDANIDRVKRELSDNGLIPEDWGGKTTCVPISARQKVGIEDLLEMILLTADLDKDKLLANPKGKTIGTIIESHIDKNEGPVATVLVQNGTLSQNDYLVIDNISFGKIRAMRDYRGATVKKALPGQPVKIIGFKSAPVVGHTVLADIALDRSLARETKRTASTSVVVTPTFHEGKGTNKGKSVNLILKTDTLGSLEAIANAILKIDNPEVKVKIVAKDLGMITSADILKADATHGFIAGFHVPLSSSAQTLALEKNVEVKMYKIIYELLDDVTSRIEKLLAPEINRIILGSAKILAVFKKETHSTIVGGVVMEGEFEPGTRAQVIRGDTSIGEGKITSLQSGKITVPNVHSGQEFGMSFEGKATIEKGDIVQVFKEEQKQRTL